MVRTDTAPAGGSMAPLLSSKSPSYLQEDKATGRVGLEARGRELTR